MGVGRRHRLMAGLLLVTALASAGYAGVNRERSAPGEGRREPPASAELARLSECAGGWLPVNPDPPDPAEDESLDACISTPTSSEAGIPKVAVASSGVNNDVSHDAYRHRGALEAAMS
jgi:hypothetical protein